MEAETEAQVQAAPHRTRIVTPRQKNAPRKEKEKEVEGRGDDTREQSASAQRLSTVAKYAVPEREQC